MKSPNPHLPKAFTLIELLTTVAIIGILAALAIPAFRSAQTIALRTTNINNLRQIGLGIISFEGDNDGHYPGNCSASNESNTKYAHLIYPYMGGSGKMLAAIDPATGAQIPITVDTAAYRSPVFHSPATPPSAYRANGAPDTTWGVYGANSAILSSDEIISSVRVFSVQRPSATILIAEKYALAGSAALSTQGPYPKVAAGPAANLRNDRNPAADPNGAGPCGFLFADGHAESIDLETLRPPVMTAWPGTLTFKAAN